MKISFIIPTLDEEKNIARVVSQFNVLKGKFDYEIIIADGGSKDKTREIAKKLGCKVFKNNRKKQNIAKNRNLGAKHSKGDILVFCDADTELKNPVFFCKIVLSKFKNKNIVAGVPKIRVFPNEENVEDKIYMKLFNKFIEMSLKTKRPMASGQCQIVKREIFFKVNGYNENLAWGEDNDLFYRLRKHGKFYFFSNLVVYESPRRYRKWGYPKLITTAAANFLSRVVLKKELVKEWKRVD
ncbi:MAG: glycosyltransferase [Candidatus Woesearchaeota archaeon]